MRGSQKADLSARRRVAVGLLDGKLIDKFDVEHHAIGFSQFFQRITPQEGRHQLPVSVPWKATTAERDRSMANTAPWLATL